MSMDSSSENNRHSRSFRDFEDPQLIGRGGFGQVFAATHKYDRRRCAIKCVKLTSENKDDALKEVRVLVTLSHDNVIMYINTWVDSDCSHSDAGEAAEFPSSGFDEDSTQNSLSKIFSAMTTSDKNNPVSKDDDNRFDDTSSDTTSTNNTADRTSQSDRSENNNNISTEMSFNVTQDTSSVNSSYVEVTSPKKTSVQSIEYLYIVTELCHNHTLHDRLQPEYRHENSIDRLRGLEIFYQIVNGMTYIHEHAQKLIHRDLKPANIFFSLPYGTAVKIGDFGLAKTIAMNETECDSSELDDGVENSQTSDEKWKYSSTNPKHGTPSYISPEQLRDEQPTQKVDIYAMGLILLELLYPISTGCERKIILDNARKASMILPIDFNEKNENKIAYSSLIRRLIIHDKDLRPTSSELQRNKKFDIDKEDYNTLKNGVQRTAACSIATEPKPDFIRNSSDIRISIERTLCTAYENQILLSSHDVQFGVFDVCNKYNVILLLEQNKLKLFNNQKRIDMLPGFDDKDIGFISCIHWCSFLDKFLILCNYRLYTLSLKLDKETSLVKLGRLAHINQIRAYHDKKFALEASSRGTQQATHIQERLRFITISPSPDHYLFLNYAYHTVEQWNMNSWQVLRKWPITDIGYNEKDEVRLITCSNDGTYLAMNVWLKSTHWIIDFKKIDSNMTHMKRINMSLNSLPLYHKIQIPFEEDQWLIINENNQFQIVYANSNDENMTPIRTEHVLPSRNSNVYLRFFRNNEYLIVGTVIGDGENRRGVLNFHKVIYQ
ncbi:unnamed protein product [Rotaria magnacalcarata]|uniref:Protein kinase domain-containing protein n=2 Tax=Rotaria magnacalcarata TaxID=392030 RepID=A0A816XYX6_9BILA|nr:unnamed protein product [Rotaria magnacalcarata]